ncbi:MAG TPA: hypothetical protein VKQ28_00085 [Candidatus Acidoferrum sp.]|nr:hypothetical protein [Candidatus Acidoferrum sp.]
MGTFRTPGQLIFQVAAVEAAGAGGVLWACNAGISGVVVRVKKAKIAAIDLLIETPSGFDEENLNRC